MLNSRVRLIPLLALATAAVALIILVCSDGASTP